MEKLISAQRDFFLTHQTKCVEFRKDFLKKLQKEIIEKEEAICDAVYADFKKPKFETLATETQFVLAELKNALNKINRWSKPKKVASTWLNWPSADYIFKEPYGSILIISPWNYPFQLAIAPLIGAIAAGNTAVIKPSEITPNTSKIIAEIINNVFPKEYVTVIEGGIEVSQELLKLKWDYIFFTGSTKVGQIVYENAAQQLIPVTLELGGKNPTIVDETAAISVAANRIVWGKFLNAGQTCIAPDYILVHKSVKNELIEKLKSSITKFYSDDIKNSLDYARTVNTKHYENLKRMLEGEKIIFGGETNDIDHYLSPTLVDEPKEDSLVMKGEIFGPILPIIAYETYADIHDFMIRYGKPLALYVFSTNKAFQKKMITDYSFGGGAINDTIIQITNKKLPFGGVGSSGIGSYHGKASFELFSHSKTIIKKGNWLDIPLRYPPYNLPLKYAKKIKNLF
tara:strand:+ start:8104 stop:9471 length:1368 start_codon:yes stop_codon:yes gene_type:complete